MLNLDTHVLIHALRGDLRPRERELLAGDSWSVAAIVLWELAKLAQLGRLTIDLDDPDVGIETHFLRQPLLDLRFGRRLAGDAGAEHPVGRPRVGWAEAAQRAREASHDQVLDAPTETRFDREEWTW